MYTFVLSLHSILRWLVVILGLVAVVRAWAGWLGARGWESLDDRLGLFFTTSMDLQLLIGLLLYFFLSPITTASLRDFGGAMSNPAQRFWAVEHLTLMLAAVVLAHVGRSLSKRADGASARHRRAAIFFGLAFLALLVAIPWPFFSLGEMRPWLRLG